MNFLERWRNILFTLSLQMKFLAFGIQKTIHRAYNHALRQVEITLALITFFGVNNINLVAFGYRPGWAYRHT